ncbi:hypothetical protein [Brotaphodocola sp.]|uniref:hypothetical protein n=1 Tax=Brotaphodocola sp. TaxID=3073577 RepID=UPI003D7C4477
MEGNQNQAQAQNQQGTGENSQAGNQNQTGQPAVIDYSKIQQMLEGTLAAKEDTALKAYFKQQGLSQQEVEQAIATFKQQKAANTPDVNAMQAQLAQAQEAAQKAQIQNAATLTAVELGINAKTIPYVLKMADLSTVMGQDGKINTENLKASLNKVLEDVPALKPQTSGASGFVQVGAASSGAGQSGNQDDQLASIFGNKKK